MFNIFSPYFTSLFYAPTWFFGLLQSCSNECYPWWFCHDWQLDSYLERIVASQVAGQSSSRLCTSGNCNYRPGRFLALYSVLHEVSSTCVIVWILNERKGGKKTQILFQGIAESKFSSLLLAYIIINFLATFCVKYQEHWHLRLKIMIKIKTQRQRGRSWSIWGYTPPK